MMDIEPKLPFWMESPDVDTWTCNGTQCQVEETTGGKVCKVCGRIIPWPNPESVTAE